MDPLVAAFWGAFFGTAALMLAGAAVAWVQSLRRVAAIAASASVTVVLFAASYLGLVPAPDEAARVRLDANVFAVCAVLLGHLVFAMIGHLREPAVARKWLSVLYGSGLVVLVA